MKVKAINLILFFISINIYSENIHRLEFIDFNENIASVTNTISHTTQKNLDFTKQETSIKTVNNFVLTNWKYLLIISLFLTYIVSTFIYMYNLSLPIK